MTFHFVKSVPGGRDKGSRFLPSPCPVRQQGEWFPSLFWRPATHLQNSQGPTALPFSRTNKPPVFLGAALSQFWVCATDPSQGAGQPNRRKVQQSQLAVPFSSCFSCNSLFVQPGADGGSGHRRTGGKASSSKARSAERGSSHVLPPAQLCCLLGWFQMEKRVGTVPDGEEGRGGKVADGSWSWIKTGGLTSVQQAPAGDGFFFLAAFWLAVFQKCPSALSPQRGFWFKKPTIFCDVFPISPRLWM